MPSRLALWSMVLCLGCPVVGGAQTFSDVSNEPATQGTAAPPTGTAFPFPTVFPSEKSNRAGAASFWAPFTALPDDFRRFFTTDTVRFLGVGGIGALAAHQWDDEGIEHATEHFRPSSFTAGNIGGGFLAQTGASIGLYSIAKLTGSDTLSAVGADLVRAQILSQTLVQAGKFATRRARPDGSDDLSLPSGHTASAFATATVVQQHFGWKLGIPAYGFGAYVAASRMSANKHHLSDVLLGATIGIAAGRTVTFGSGKTQFDMGVAPTRGGAMVTFTK
jgi:membrane-associated phospholipid phosphatase